ncbi:MAG: hypothetical protein ACRCZ9_07080 [Fusobacteriaceae bacterium]
MTFQENIEALKKELGSINKRKDIVIIGDNSSGKSKLIKEYIKDGNKKNQNIYYIDSVNRAFNYGNINEIYDYDGIPLQDILEGRIGDNNYNLRDSFGLTNIEQYYKVLKFDFLKIIKEFLNLEIDIKLERIGIGRERVIKVNGERYDTLSSGYQAIFRIFLELLYVEKFFPEVDTIIIDEINEFLSTGNECKILPFLKKRFSKYKYIVTTHSADLVSSVENGALFIIKEGNYEILDCNDFVSTDDVRIIFKKLFLIKDEEDNRTNSILRKLLNKKIMEDWSDFDEKELEEIGITKLSNSQKLLLKEIKEW